MLYIFSFEKFDESIDFLTVSGLALREVMNREMKSSYPSPRTKNRLPAIPGHIHILKGGIYIPNRYIF
jgi:hypothetical protein